MLGYMNILVVSGWHVLEKRENVFTELMVALKNVHA